MVGTTIAGAFAVTEYLLFILPVVAFYFTTQILYSYQVHYALSDFLVEKIEKNIIKIIESDNSSEWQGFINSTGRISSGARKNFFVWCMWGVSLGSMACLAMLFTINNKTDLFHIIALTVCSTIYIFLNTMTTYRFAKKGDLYSKHTIIGNRYIKHFEQYCIEHNIDHKCSACFSEFVSERKSMKKSQGKQELTDNDNA